MLAAGSKSSCTLQRVRDFAVMKPGHALSLMPGPLRLLLTGRPSHNSFVRSLVRSFVCSINWSLVCPFVHWFVDSSVRGHCGWDAVEGRIGRGVDLGAKVEGASPGGEAWAVGLGASEKLLLWEAPGLGGGGWVRVKNCFFWAAPSL
jgi:hypothetical protein